MILLVILLTIYVIISILIYNSYFRTFFKNPYLDKRSKIISALIILIWPLLVVYKIVYTFINFINKKIRNK